MRRFRQWKSLCIKDLGIESMASTRGVGPLENRLFKAGQTPFAKDIEFLFLPFPVKRRQGFGKVRQFGLEGKDFRYRQIVEFVPLGSLQEILEMSVSEITENHEAPFQIMGDDFRNVDIMFLHTGANAHEGFEGSKSGGASIAIQVLPCSHKRKYLGNSRPKRPTPAFRPRRKCDAEATPPTLLFFDPFPQPPVRFLRKPFAGSKQKATAGPFRPPLEGGSQASMFAQT